MRLVKSLAFFLVLALVVGYLVSGSAFMDWAVAGGLFAVAVVGEGLRYWLRRTRAKKRDSTAV
jgi:hypothetical protein